MSTDTTGQRNVIAFNGSPRKRGNTETLLDAALEGVRSTGANAISFAVGNLQVIPCQNCGYCSRHGACRLADKDDMGQVYRSIDTATRFLTASPVYFATVSAQLKTLIDRCQVFWSRKFVLEEKPRVPDRKGILLAVGGFDHRGFWPCTQKVVRTWYVCCDVNYLGGLFYHKIDARGDIARHPTALEEAFEAGKRLVAGEGPDPSAAGAK